MNQKSDRNDVIDGYRGIAIISVLLFHYLVRFRPPQFPVDLLGYDATFPAALQVGSCGVQLFFVISGLVITMTMQRSATALEFAARRFARIYPAFIVALTFTFIMMRWLGPVQFRSDWLDYAANFSLMPSELGRQYVDGAYWSLTVELKFYLWMGLFRLAFGQRFWIGAVAIAVLGQVVAPWHAYSARLLFLNQYMPLFLLGIGGWFAIFEKRKSLGGGIMIVAIALWELVIWRAAPGSGVSSAWYPQLYIAAFSLSMLALLWLAPKLSFGPLAWIGRISYSLYLVHQSFGVTLIGGLKRVHAPDWVAFLLATTASVAIAAAMFYLVEGPAKTWIMRIFRTRTSPSSPRASILPS